MIKLIIYFFLNFFLFTFIKADIVSVNILKNRLKQIDNFYICFVQKVDTIDNNIKEINHGELWIKKPNLFHCHIFDPEESFLISDGKTIWFYVPIIKQVTAYNLKNSIIDNIFLKLLLNHDVYKWNDYDIIQKEDCFYINPNFFEYCDCKKYKIKINDKGIISQFCIFEPNRPEINYHLYNQQVGSIDISKFQFIISEDIQLDDQRQ